MTCASARSLPFSPPGNARPLPAEEQRLQTSSEISAPNKPLPPPLQRVQVPRMPEPKAHSEAEVLVREAMGLYESPLIAYAANILSGDIDRARDVVQDTFLRLFQADVGRVRENLKAWLYTVCRNRAFDVLRKDQRLDLGGDEVLLTFSDHRPDPSQSTDTSEMCDRAWQLMERLSSNQREVIRLKFVDDCSYKDIARITGLSIGNVGFLMHVGLRKLRDLLTEELSETTH